jgi:hypothetical protein
VSDLNDRFEPLANRGTRRGVDAVFGDAMREVQEAEQREGNGHGFVGSQGDLAVLAEPEFEPFDDVQVVQLEEAKTARKGRRPWKTAVAAGGLAAMLGVVTMGVASLLAGGGADDAEGAVRQLADAIEHEDPLAAVDVLNPDEIRSLRSTVDTVSQRAKELELVNDAAAPFAGVDLTVNNLGLSTEELAPGYVKVSVTDGEIDSTINRDGLADLIARRTNDPSYASQLRREDLIADGHDPFVVVIERGDGWYISPAYTVLEYIRVLNDLPAADYGSAVTSAPGAASPEAAAEDALRAFSAGDWGRLFELSAPNELPLYDYRTPFLQGLADASPPGFTIDSFDASSEVNGDTALITVRAAGTTEDGGSWSLDDRCLSVDNVDTYDGETETYTSNYCPSPTLSPLGGPPMFFVGFGYDSEPAADGYVRFLAVQRDGKWFLSPVGSVLNMLDYVIANASEESVYGMLGMYDELDVQGAVQLGAEVRGTATHSYQPFVYTLEGTAGQTILGEYDHAAANEYGDYATVFLYGPDGAELYDAYGILEGENFSFPSTGTYKLVVLPYDAGEFSFTLYDLQDAPDDVLNPPHECTTENAPGYCQELIDEGCTFSPDGSTECPSDTAIGSDAVCVPSGPGEESCSVSAPTPTPTTYVDEECVTEEDGSYTCYTASASGEDVTATTIAMP